MYTCIQYNILSHTPAQEHGSSTISDQLILMGPDPLVVKAVSLVGP